MAEASNSKIEFFVWLSRQVMGGLCSRSAEVDRVFADSGADAAAHKRSNNGTDFTTAPQVRERMERNQNQQELAGISAAATADEDFYNGIPRFAAEVSLPHKSRAKQAAVAKVSEVSSRLGRAGIGKAVEVLDTLGCSMTNLNAGTGPAINGSKISILAFEVANTIVKGFNLLQSLSTKSIRHLKEEVLLSEALQDLVSEDKEELLRFVAADKWQELKVFSNEVAHFGNRLLDPQWHNLDRYFENIKL